MNNIRSSFENLSQEKIQNAIGIQPKVMETMIAADGDHTTSMSSGTAKKWEAEVSDFLILNTENP